MIYVLRHMYIKQAETTDRQDRKAQTLQVGPRWPPRRPRTNFAASGRSPCLDSGHIFVFVCLMSYCLIGLCVAVGQGLVVKTHV